MKWFDKFLKKQIIFPSSQNRNPVKHMPDGTIKFNLSKKDEYYSQRNNEDKRLSACNTTALVNSLIASDIQIPITKGVQPEDIFTRLLETQEAYKAVLKHAPWLKGTEPRLIAIMLSWAAHRLLGKKYCVSSSQGTLQELVYNMVVERGCAIALGSYTKSGHYVSIVGFVTKQSDIADITNPDDVSVSALQYIIQDDPYGDYNSGYTIRNGNDIMISIDVYNRIVWGKDNRKYLNFIRKKGFDIQGYKIKKYPV